MKRVILIRSGVFDPKLIKKLKDFEFRKTDKIICFNRIDKTLKPILKNKKINFRFIRGYGAGHLTKDYKINDDIEVSHFGCRYIFCPKNETKYNYVKNKIHHIIKANNLTNYKLITDYFKPPEYPFFGIEDPKRKSAYPTAGFMAIKYCEKYMSDYKIILMGFTFRNTLDGNRYRNHNYEAEEAYVKKKKITVIS